MSCRTDTDYDDALIAKLYVFMFVNSYASLFFVAFVKVSAWAGVDPCVESSSIGGVGRMVA